MTWCQVEMDQFKPPTTITFDGNIKEKWRKWRQQFEIFMKATEGGKKDAAVQIAMFLNCIGDEGLEIYNSFAEKGATLQAVLDQFNTHCNPSTNEIVERVSFFRNLQNGKPVDQYITELKNKANHCEFGNIKNSMLITQIILGIDDDAVRERLLRMPNVAQDLSKVIEAVRIAEMTKNNAQIIRN